MAEPVIAYGWDGSAWRKLPLVWGYSSPYAERKYNLDAAADDNTINGSTVPLGEVWVVQAVTLLNNTSVCSRLGSYVAAGDAYVYLLNDQNPVLMMPAFWTGEIVLPAGGYVSATFYGCTAGDDLYLDMNGYKMKIAE